MSGIVLTGGYVLVLFSKRWVRGPKKRCTLKFRGCFATRRSAEARKRKLLSYDYGGNWGNAAPHPRYRILSVRALRKLEKRYGVMKFK